MAPKSVGSKAGGGGGGAGAAGATELEELDEPLLNTLETAPENLEAIEGRLELTDEGLGEAPPEWPV